MPVPVPATNPDGSLRYYTPTEKALIDLRHRGVSGTGDHMVEEFGPDGSSCVRRYSCAYDERYAAVVMLVGYAKLYDAGGEPPVLKVSRLMPDTHPNAAKFNWVCTKARVLPFRYTGAIDPAGFGQDVPRFTRADIEATYELVPYELEEDGVFGGPDDEMFRYTIHPGHGLTPVTVDASYIQFAGGSQKFRTPTGVGVPAGVPVPYNVGFPESLRRFSFVWERVPSGVWGPEKPLTRTVLGDGTPVNRGYIGALNRTALFGRPPLTLKLEGVGEQLVPDPSGVGYSWRISYLMSEKAVPYGHLGFWFTATAATGGTSGYYQVGSASAGTVTADADTIAANDGSTVFHVREFSKLWNPNGG